MKSIRPQLEVDIHGSDTKVFCHRTIPPEVTRRQLQEDIGGLPSQRVSCPPQASMIVYEVLKNI